MVKTKTLFACQECGAQYPRWTGRCSSCNSWNSIVEEIQSAPDERRGGLNTVDEGPVLLHEVGQKEEKRTTTNIAELDRVLGGGIVQGSVTLIGGDPGIGKSTLSLQIGSELAKRDHKVLYVSGEESVKQTSMRAKRINADPNKLLYIVNQVNLDTILKFIKKMNPDVVVIDSIQVVYRSEITSAAGSVSQVRECASILTHIAKQTGISLFIIGHVTKDGAIAGPRVLEHIVDTVLYFEGERYSSYRVLRATKNRFGSTNEIGVFEMAAEGLLEVLNPSEIFLSERPTNACGSVVVPIMEGTRPFLVEIQGLVSRSSYSVMRHKAQGFDANRLSLLIAVLEKRIGLSLADKDVFLNVVGGVRVMDPAADLAVIAAMAAALLDKTVNFTTTVLGEVGLSSEVRSVSQIAARINEAEKLGFTKCIVPENNLKQRQKLSNKNIEIIPVSTVKQALDILEITS